jgi:subtilisin family serine protease
MRKGFYFIGLFLFVLVVSSALKMSPQAQFVNGEVLVKFKPEYSAQSVETVLSQLSANTIVKIPAIGVRHIKLAPGQTVEKAVQYLTSLKSVIYAEPVYYYKSTAQPNDPLFVNQWGMNNAGQSSGTAGADIRAIEAWDVAQGADEIIVGIVDTGIDYSHEDLSVNFYTNPGEDAWTDPNNPATGNHIDDDGNGMIDDWKGWNFFGATNNAADDNMHGTHCAGIIGAVGNNSKGIAGINWRIRLLSLKFLNNEGTGSSVDAINAIIYGTDQGARILNNSWGGSGFSNALQDAISYANDHGVLFVAAAGNDGVNTDSAPEYPACYELPNIISVAASDRNDQRALWGDTSGGGDDCGFVCSRVIAAVPGSNYGLQSVDLAAPGKDILSCTPGNQYEILSGTSMATPFVSGAVGLVWAKHPSLTAIQVKEKILSTVDKLAAFKGIVVSEGRLNLAAALK